MNESREADFDVEALRSLSAGETKSNPYKNIDVENLPCWWKAAIEEFESHNLRPYRPPRFNDGELKYKIVKCIEQEYHISIRFVCHKPEDGEPWVIEVNGEKIGEVDRRRSVEGYSVFDIDSDSFLALVEDSINETS